MSCLSVGGADDTHVVAGMEVAQLQQHHGQVVHEELGVHERRGELDDAVVVFILLRTHRALMSAAAAGISKARIGLLLQGNATIDRSIQIISCVIDYETHEIGHVWRRKHT